MMRCLTGQSLTFALALLVSANVALDAFGVGGTAPAVVLADAPAAGLKTAEMLDRHIGDMAALHIAIPADWNFSGTVLRPTDCRGGRPQPAGVYRTESRDGLTGVQLLPNLRWIMADQARTIRNVGVVNCPVYGDLSIRQLGALIAAGRPNAKIVEVAGAIDGNFAGNLKQENDSYQAMSPPSVRATYPPPEARGEQGRVRLNYMLNGHAVEEWIVINKVIARWKYASSVDNMGRGISWGWIDYYRAEIFALRAPQGRLDGEFNRLVGIRRSAGPNPDWYAKESAEQRAFDQKVINKTNADSERNYEMLHNQAVSMMQGALAGEDQAQRHAQDATDLLAGRQFSRNSATGQTGYVPLDQESAYQNGRTGEVVTSTNANFNPNEPGQNMQNPGDWDRLTPIHH